MSSENLIVSLAKVLIAAAWADGELNNEEVNIMKDLLYQLPTGSASGNSFYTAREWSEIEMYLDSPVPPEERARLIAELQAELQTDKIKSWYSMHWTSWSVPMASSPEKTKPSSTRSVCR
jgi:hypothetical protein